jgi:hypothetical protein
MSYSGSRAVCLGLASVLLAACAHTPVDDGSKMSRDVPDVNAQTEAAGGGLPPVASGDTDVMAGTVVHGAAPDELAGPGTAVTSSGAVDTSCVAMDDSEAWRHAECEHFELVVDELELVDARGGGVVPGDNVELRARLSDVSGLGYYMYPGLEFSADDPRVSFGPHGNTSWLYAVLACQQMEVSISATFDAAIPPGTPVTISAQPAALNQTCTSASATSLRIMIE